MRRNHKIWLLSFWKLFKPHSFLVERTEPLTLHHLSFQFSLITEHTGMETLPSYKFSSLFPKTKTKTKTQPKIKTTTKWKTSYEKNKTIKNRCCSSFLFAKSMFVGSSKHGFIPWTQQKEGEWVQQWVEVMNNLTDLRFACMTSHSMWGYIGKPSKW